MKINENGLFPALEEVLKTAKAPLTCVQLYDLPQIRQLASSANRVSDYLGGLWRKGRISRVPAPKTTNSAARWAYVWRTSQPAISYSEPIDYTPDVQKILARPNLEILEEGNRIRIDMPTLTITIERKT